MRAPLSAPARDSASVLHTSPRLGAVSGRGASITALAAEGRALGVSLRTTVGFAECAATTKRAAECTDDRTERLTEGFARRVAEIANAVADRPTGESRREALHAHARRRRAHRQAFGSCREAPRARGEACDSHREAARARGEAFGTCREAFDASREARHADPRR
jgi:hypothetical protein